MVSHEITIKIQFNHHEITSKPINLWHSQMLHVWNIYLHLPEDWLSFVGQFSRHHASHLANLNGKFILARKVLVPVPIDVLKKSGH